MACGRPSAWAALGQLCISHPDACAPTRLHPPSTPTRLHPSSKYITPQDSPSCPLACLLQYLTTVVRDGRAGATTLMLLLPTALHTMLASAVLYGACLGTLVILEARFPGIASGLCQHAAVPLTWQGLVSAARQQQLQSLLPALAAAVVLPVLVNCALRWLQFQQQQPQQRQAAAAQPASGSGGSIEGVHGSSKVQHDGKEAGCPAASFSWSTSCSSSCSGSSSHRSDSQGCSDPTDILGAGPSTPLHSSITGREDDVSRQDQDSVELPPSSAQQARLPLYKSPVYSGQPLLMHLKLVGADAAAEAACVEQLPDALASVLGDAEAAAAAWQLLHVSTFSGAWGAAA